MRSYILTAYERLIIREYMRSPDQLSPKEYTSWCQIRHQFRKHGENIRQDLDLLTEFMATERRPACFGSNDVQKLEDGSFPPKCRICDVEGKCLEENLRRTGVRIHKKEMKR